MESERREREYISAENTHVQVCNFFTHACYCMFSDLLKGLITVYIYMYMSLQQQSSTINALYEFAIKIIVKKLYMYMYCTSQKGLWCSDESVCTVIQWRPSLYPLDHTPPGTY